jgi:iron complex transport system substrate-binding protein
MTVGQGSFVAELIALAGGCNIGDELTRDYATVSLEWVLDRDPDLIVSLVPGAPGAAQARLAERIGWRELRAVREQRVLDGFDLDTLSRPGPRVLEAVDHLTRALMTPPPPRAEVP